MGFTPKIKEDILIASARHCCVCHRYKGVKLEVHHIIPREQGGKDTFENGIALCFDCHSDAGHYYANHPKGIKLSPSELRKHKEAWFKNVKENNIQMPAVEMQVELNFNEKNIDDTLRPIFIEEITVFRNRNDLKRRNYEEVIDGMRTGNLVRDHFLNKIKSFDDFVEYLNGVDIEKYNNGDPEKEKDPQPVRFSSGYLGLGSSKDINLSVCVVDLKLINHGPEVLEDYKVYLNFENVIKADSVYKRKDYFDLNKYKYNVHFKNSFEAEFIPERPVLVQNDSVELDQICFKTSYLPTVVCLNWRVVARNFSISGQLELNILPIIETERKTKFVDNPDRLESFKKIKSKHEYE